MTISISELKSSIENVRLLFKEYGFPFLPNSAFDIVSEKLGTHYFDMKIEENTCKSIFTIVIDHESPGIFSLNFELSHFGNGYNSSKLQLLFEKLNNSSAKLN